MGIARVVTFACVCLCVCTLTAVDAADMVKGSLVVNGKPVPLSVVHVYSQPGFFNKKAKDTVVLACDTAVSDAAVRDLFERKPQVAAGTLHCVELTIDTDKQIISFRVEHKAFGGYPPSGGSTENVFEATTFDGKTIAGRAHTKSTQKSFEDVPYSFDFTVNAVIVATK
jgi:hypothetical protein